MNAKTRRKLDMFERARICVLQYGLRDAGAVAVAAFDRLETSIDRLRTAAGNQVTGRSESAGGVSWREDCWRELRRRLTDVNRTARILGHVSIRPKFRLPRTRSYPALIVAAKVIVAAARAMEEQFHAAGMAPDFLEEIEQLLAAFETATDQKIDGKRGQVEATVALAEEARLGLAAATTLDACARNFFRKNPVAMGAWITARHIERSPRRTANEAADLQETSTDLAAGTADVPAAHERPRGFPMHLEPQISQISTD